jgi:hypothetical protein
MSRRGHRHTASKDRDIKDGNRVKSMSGNGTTVFIVGSYEVIKPDAAGDRD